VSSGHSYSFNDNTVQWHFFYIQYSIRCDTAILVQIPSLHSTACVYSNDIIFSVLRIIQQSCILLYSFLALNGDSNRDEDDDEKQGAEEVTLKSQMMPILSVVLILHICKRTNITVKSYYLTLGYKSIHFLQATGFHHATRNKLHKDL